MKPQQGKNLDQVLHGFPGVLHLQIKARQDFQGPARVKGIRIAQQRFKIRQYFRSRKLTNPSKALFTSTSP